MDAVQKTIETAQGILVQHGSLAEASLETAEATARAINSGSIDVGLFLHLTIPKVKPKRLYMQLSTVKMLQESTADPAKDIEERSRMVSPPIDPRLSSKKTKKSKNKNRIDKPTKPIAHSGIESRVVTDTDIPVVLVQSESLDKSSSQDDGMRMHHSVLEPLPTIGDYDDDAFSTSTPQRHRSSDEDFILIEEPVTDLIEDTDATSEESQQHFYTPQEFSPCQHRQKSAPTTLMSRNTEKEPSVSSSNRGILAEKVGLEEENPEWESTPKEECPPKLFFISSILADFDASSQPDPQAKVASARTDPLDTVGMLDVFNETRSDDPVFKHQVMPSNIDDDVLSNSPVRSRESSQRTTKDQIKDGPPKIHTLYEKVSKGEIKREQSKQQSETTTQNTHFWRSRKVEPPSFGRQHTADSSISGTDDSNKRLVLGRRSPIDLHQDPFIALQRRPSSAESHRPDDAAKGWTPVAEEPIATPWDDQLEDRDGTTTMNGPAIKFLKEEMTGPHGLAWAYESQTSADGDLREGGIWLWDRPRTCYEPSNPRTIIMDGEVILAPAIIEQACVGNPTEPRTTFEGSVVRIVPHFPPWQDVRSNVAHPDFLPSFKLAEYQACEVSGYQVWRHDRGCTACSWGGCRKPTSDFNAETRICIGCGPKSSTRYCCHKHELKDMKNHWEVCGNYEVILKCIIDSTTAPGYFHNLCPSIKDRHGIRSFALHRQRHFSCHCQGHYTLFDPVSEKPTTLSWPKTDLHWREMDARIERLLNIAFFDTRKQSTLRYLYGLLRHLISITPLNSYGSLFILKTQFGAEFGTRLFRTTDAEPVFPCECEWYGRELDPKRHLQSCPQRHAGLAIWPEFGGQGLIREVADMEAKYWILRAWAQQHPVFQNWRDRAEGRGFGEGLGKAVIKLGPGFIGWTAEADNVCG